MGVISSHVQRTADPSPFPTPLQQHIITKRSLMLWWSVEGTVAKAALMAMTERRAHIFACAIVLLKLNAGMHDLCCGFLKSCSYWVCWGLKSEPNYSKRS